MVGKLRFEQVARIAKALSAPKRLELVDLLAQGPRSVDALAVELNIDIKLASAHLRVLREACLVTSQRQGKRVFYAIADDDVWQLSLKMHRVAEHHLAQLQHALQEMTIEPNELVAMDRQTLLEKARTGEVVLIDVRPQIEYEAGHLPFALNFPLAEIEASFSELPKDRQIVAYCRGPYCVFAQTAAHQLQKRGFRVSRLSDGVLDWKAAGFQLESSVETS